MKTESYQPSPVETPVRSAEEILTPYVWIDNKLKANVSVMDAMLAMEEFAAQFKPSVVGEKDRKHIAQILRDNITFSGQVGDYVIHGAIDKIIQWANSRVGEKEEQRFTIEEAEKEIAYLRDELIRGYGWKDERRRP